MADQVAGEIESEEDALKHGIGLPALWIKHIERAKEDEKAWRESAQAAVKIYEAQAGKGEEEPAFNILHANIETTVPALYNSTPIPDVRRRYGDLDEVAKLAVDAIERGLSYNVDEYDFDGSILEAVRDAELAGRGFVRVRYEPETTDQQSDGGEAYQAVGAQKLTCEHVAWDRWGHGPARRWDDVPWLYFDHDFTREDLEGLGLTPERIDALSFNDKDKDKDADDKASSGVFKTVEGWEVWDKKRKAVIFIAKQDKNKFLAVRPDPIGLRDFFPGRSLQPLRVRRDLTPICPYEVYKSQVQELERITRRIKSLINQCRVRGIVDSRLKATLELLKDCDDGHYEAAEDATQFAAGAGGLERAVAHWPLQEIIVVLKELYVQREQVKQTIYEVTGLSDVLRGSTDPRETLGAQQLKAQSGSQRLSQRQGKVARFCRDIFRIKAEIMCKHFTAENLSAMTGIQITPEVDTLLKNEMLRSYRIDIESDSTIRADIARTQEQMSNFLQGTAQYASAMAPVLQLTPGAAAPIIEIYAAFARNFKLGKSAEDALDKMIQGAQQPQPEKPDPDQMKMQMEQQKMQAQMQMDQQSNAMQQQVERAKAQRETEKMQMELQIKMQIAEIDRQAKMLDLQVKREMAQLDMQKAQMELGMKREAMELDREAKVYDIQTKQQMSEVDIASRKAKADQEHEAREAKMEAAD